MLCMYEESMKSQRAQESSWSIGISKDYGGQET